jgi:hypothetical protein
MAGTFYVTITDNGGCTLIDSVVITEPVSPLSMSSISTDITCFGLTDGSANATPLGGTNPYNYTWSNGSTSNAISNLSSGIYSVTVIDNSGFCIALSGIVIIEPLKLTSSDSVNGVKCFNGNDGAASLLVAGGITPYTYIWDANANNQTSLTASNLTVGTYQVNVADSNGCLFDTTVNVPEPAIMALSTSNVPVSCFDGTDGTVTVNPLGGSAPYTYLWDASANNQTTKVASSLIAGGYSVTVTDTNGCNASIIANTTEPNALNVTAVQISNVSCYGDSNGSAGVTINGGVAPYAYSWNLAANLQSTANATGLPNGAFNVLITDTNGCFLDTTVIVNQPTAFLTHTSTVTNVLCFGGNSGTVNITPSG